LLSYLQQNTAGMKYLMAVPSSMAGAGYVLATGRPVLYIGGFNGQDPVATSTDLARLVTEGQLRYVYWGGGGGSGSSGQSSISAWVASQCTVVAGLSSASASSGAGGFAPGPGGSQGTLNLEAAFKRIQAAMTTDQLQAIQSMDLSSQNMLALAQKLAIAMPAGANSQPPAGTPGPGGPPGLQGTPMPGDPPGIGGNGTPAAPGVGGGFETVWYQAVINLLQQKTQ
jgi:hypothetical protein